MFLFIDHEGKSKGATKTISIHLMFLFIMLRITSGYSNCMISIHLMFLFISSDNTKEDQATKFQYI